jgi:hypothetical protein
MFNERKGKFPGMASLLRANTQPPKQSSYAYELFIFFRLSLNSIGYEPNEKTEPIDLHRYHLS